MIVSLGCTDTTHWESPCPACTVLGWGTSPAPPHNQVEPIDTSVILALGKWRQDEKFKAILDYMLISYLA